MVDEEKEEEGRREITFTYEHLPDFCYVCGIIGHGDRTCPSKQKLGPEHEFGPWLKAEEWLRSPSEEDRSKNSREKWGFGKSSSGGSKGSDAISWKKNSSEGDGTGVSRKGEEKEVMSPLKKQANKEEVGARGKKLSGRGIDGKECTRSQE